MGNFARHINVDTHRVPDGFFQVAYAHNLKLSNQNDRSTSLVHSNEEKSYIGRKKSKQNGWSDREKENVVDKKPEIILYVIFHASHFVLISLLLKWSPIKSVTMRTAIKYYVEFCWA